MKKRQVSSHLSAHTVTSGCPNVYLRMPKCFNNAGPTFGRITKAILKEQMERNVYAYIDDIVVASRKKETQLQDLRGFDTFEWGPEQQEAFNALKEYIQKLPTIASPQLDQQLTLYVLATHTALSEALVQDRVILEGDKKLSHQVPLCFVSKAPTCSKKYYSEMEKMCYAVVMSAKKLRYYFKAHRVRVLSNQPRNDIFGNHDSSGRIGKWAMELSEHIIDFDKRR
jgi:hypothetical protein